MNHLNHLNQSSIFRASTSLTPLLFSLPKGPTCALKPFILLSYLAVAPNLRVLCNSQVLGGGLLLAALEFGASLELNSW